MSPFYELQKGASHLRGGHGSMLEYALRLKADFEPHTDHCFLVALCSTSVSNRMQQS